MHHCRRNRDHARGRLSHDAQQAELTDPSGCLSTTYALKGCGRYDEAGFTADGSSNMKVCDALPTFERPAWCTSSFCYVDPNNCNRPNTRSNWWNKTAMGQDMYYSYHTCGNVDNCKTARD